MFAECRGLCLQRPAKLVGMVVLAGDSRPRRTFSSSCLEKGFDEGEERRNAIPEAAGGGNFMWVMAVGSL
jgi:hypothetical protein